MKSLTKNAVINIFYFVKILSEHKFTSVLSSGIKRA